MPPIINKEKCNGCGRCVDVCSEDVLYSPKKLEVPIVAYPEECWHCNSCWLDCPVEGAIKLRIPLPQMVCHK